MALRLEEEYENLYRYCYYRVRDRYLAEDLTQEAFLRYLDRESGLPRERRLPYLYTIARNLCIDIWREKSVQKLPEMEGAVFPMENIADRMVLLDAVRALPDEEQELIALRYGADKRMSEAAKILGISRFALYRREKGVLKKLRIYMEGGQNR